MNGDYGNDFVTIRDDEGNEFELEHLDTVEIDGNIYMAFLPADLEEEDEDYGMVILKVITQNNEEIFATVDDEAELTKAYASFIDRLNEE